MSNKTAVVFSCAHTDPSISNERFDLLGELIYDINPSYVVDLGDGADMKSLNSFDTRYPEAIVSQNYGQDIEHYNGRQVRDILRASSNGPLVRRVPRIRELCTLHC